MQGQSPRPPRIRTEAPALSAAPSKGGLFGRLLSRRGPAGPASSLPSPAGHRKAPAGASRRTLIFGALLLCVLGILAFTSWSHAKSSFGGFGSGGQSAVVGWTSALQHGDWAALNLTDIQDFCLQPWWQRGTNASFLQACQAPQKPGEDEAADPEGAGAVVGMPKVALLFLTRGHLPHEPLWAAWFRTAAGQLRADCLGAALCSHGPRGAESALINLQQAEAGIPASNPIARQSMFSVLVHAPPVFRGERGTAVGDRSTGQLMFRYGPDSMFRGTLIPDDMRLRTGWGEHSTTEVSRRMLRVALEDPLNQRFLLVSEVCVPLYPPTVMYAQLMGEDKSRLNACAKEGWHTQSERWSDRMNQWGLEKWHWRKHWQWFEIHRNLAQVVADDDIVSRIFAEHCKNAWDHDQGKHRMCFSDEHYMSTMLAWKGMEDQTDCRGELTWADWEHGEIVHPKTYRAHEVSTELLHELRTMGGQCDPQLATRRAAQVFVSVGDIQRGRCRGAVPASLNEPAGALSYSCYLLARKFPPEVATLLLDMAEVGPEMGILQAGEGACSPMFGANSSAMHPQ